jgi:hypothetical protein
MDSMNSKPASRPIPFPKYGLGGVAAGAKTTKVAVADADEIHVLCRDTALALQELRHGVLNVLLSSLETLDLDTITLVQVLDARPSIVRALVKGDLDEITTDTLLRWVEALRPYWQPGNTP